MAHSDYQNPFVGLRAFEESEDYLFFGRGKEIDDLLKKFSENRFLAVIGSSGSGKSSLVKSGMLPQIYGGFLKSGGNWRVALMQPGENPIGYLARQLAGEGVLYNEIEHSELPYESVIESRLRRSENGLQHVFTDAHLPAGENLLIIVDQFEELFRFSRYEKENKLGKSDAMHFIQILLRATQQADYPIYVLLTMRSDFLGDCSEFRGLPEAINEGQYLVPRMTRDEIREAITGPVAVSNATISDRLVTRLLNDINNDTDQLPILQHALMRTWDFWHKRGQHDSPIDFDDYEQIGTMETALSRHADEAYGELSGAQEQQVCEKMFKALTDTSADTRGIRRPRSITDLCILTGAGQKEIKAQVEIFRKPGRTFLMPPAGVALADDTVIDISHESLMRVWRRLVGWTQEEAQSGELYLRLASSARLHGANQRGLLKQPELGIALRWKEVNRPTEKWAEGYKADFGQTMRYLEESRLGELAEEAAAAKRRSRKRMTRYVFAALALLLIAGLLIAISLNSEKNVALAAKVQADNARNKALLSERSARLSDSRARIARDSALAAQDRAESAQLMADSNAALAALRANEATVQRQQAIVQQRLAEVERGRAEQLRQQAQVNTFRNAPSEYARLIREGPVSRAEIQSQGFDYKLTAYADHLDLLGRIIAASAPDAVDKYNSVQDRLYYNNDLYEKVYACMQTIADPAARRSLFDRDFPYKGDFDGDLDLSKPAFQSINTALQGAGLRVIKIIEDKKDRRVLCATDDNWIYVYSTAGGAPVLENRIPMGTPVTALGYSAEKDIIYFGLKTGNIGYILYGKDRKNQLVFENYLGSPVVSVQLFRINLRGAPVSFLLAATEKSKVVVYKLDEGSLRPDRNLFGNVLPEKNLGTVTNAQFDPRSQLVVIRAQTQKSNAPSYYAWNPFTALALEEYRKYRNDPAFLERTSIY